MSENMSNACLKCKYRGTVPNSVHSTCKHPHVLGMDSETYRTVIRRLAAEEEIIRISGGMSVHFEEQGVKGGWALWPFTFDPLWLIECLGFEEV